MNNSKKKMIIRGWQIWENIIQQIPQFDKTSFFVILIDSLTDIGTIQYLIKCYRNAKKDRNIYIISDKHLEKKIKFIENVEGKIILDTEKLEYLISYYSIHKFSEYFFVFPAREMRCNFEEALKDLSTSEIIGLGILGLKKENLI